MKARVIVAIEIDLEALEKAHCSPVPILNFLKRFQQQGEDWQREVKADPMLRDVVKVEVGQSEN